MATTYNPYKAPTYNPMAYNPLPPTGVYNPNASPLTGTPPPLSDYSQQYGVAGPTTGAYSQYGSTPLNPWGTAGPLQAQYTREDMGEDNAYWSPEELATFSQAGFQYVPMGNTGSFLYNGQTQDQWDDATINQARQLGVLEGNQNVQLGGQEYQQVGDFSDGIFQIPEARAAAESQVIYDPTYGYLLPAQSYSAIGQEYGQEGDFGDYLPFVAAAGLGGLAGAYGSTLAAGEAATAGGYGAGVGSGFAEGGTTIGGAGSTLPESYWSMTAGATPETAIPGAVEGGVVTEPYGVAEFGEGPMATGPTPVMGPPVSPPVASSMIPGVSDQVLTGGILAGTGLLSGKIQTDAYEDMAAAERARVAPYDQKLQESYAPDFNLWDQPGYEAAFQQNLDEVTRKVTASMGNPANNPAAQDAIQREMDAIYFRELTNYRAGLTQAAGLTTGAVPAQAGAINAQGQGMNALGYGAAYATSPYGGMPYGYGGVPAYTYPGGAPPATVMIGGVPYTRSAY